MRELMVKWMPDMMNILLVSVSREYLVMIRNNGNPRQKEKLTGACVLQLTGKVLELDVF